MSHDKVVPTNREILGQEQHRIKYIVDTDLQRFIGGCRNSTQSLLAINPEAQIGLLNITDPRKQLTFSQNYVYGPKLDYVTEALEPFYRYAMDLDIYHLPGVVTFTDPQTGEERRISPPLAFQNENGQLQLIDGHSRVQNAIDRGLDLDVIVIRGIPPQYLTKSYPVKYEDIKRYQRYPKSAEKKLSRRPDINQGLIIDFSPIGSKGQMVEEIERQKSFFPEDPTEGSKKLSRELKRQIRNVLAELEANIGPFDGLFPAAVAPNRESTSRVTELLGVIPVDDHHFMPVLKILWGDAEGEQRTSIYRPLCETREKQRKNISQVIIVPGDQELELNHATRPKGEVRIPNETRATINEELKRLNLSTIASFENPEVSLQAPLVTGINFIGDNKKYFTVGVFNGPDTKFGCIFNRVDVNPTSGEPVSGTEFVMRTPEGKIVMVSHYRELFGMTLLEVPRMFGFSTERLFRETGYDLSQENCQRVSTFTVTENGQSSNNHLSLISVDLVQGYQPTGSRSANEDFFEQSEVVLLTDQEVHDKIANGSLYCKIDVAGITCDQILKDKLIVNPNHEPVKVVLEKYYSPTEGRYFYRPPQTSPNIGVRVGQNSFSNTGTIVSYNHVEISDVSGIPLDTYCESFTGDEIFSMMTNGQLDTDAIADLSIALRNQNILVINQPN